VVHVRTDGEAPVRGWEPRELAAEGGAVEMRADTLISRTAEGAFEPVALALEKDAGVYELALYQTVLLGMGFGIADAEGGLIAAFIVHARWNLLNVA
jgi:hypothetical protein